MAHQPKHGTATEYDYWHCRCDACRKAWGCYRRAKRADYRRWDMCIDCGKRSDGFARCAGCRERDRTYDRQRKKGASHVSA